MFWKIWQLAIAFGVMAYIIHDNTLHNGYAMGFLAFLAAWFATSIPLWFIDRFRRWRGMDTSSPAHQSETAPVRNGGPSQWLEASERDRSREKLR